MLPYLCCRSERQKLHSGLASVFCCCDFIGMCTDLHRHCVQHAAFPTHSGSISVALSSHACAEIDMLQSLRPDCSDTSACSIRFTLGPTVADTSVGIA